MAVEPIVSPVRLHAIDSPTQPPLSPAVEELYRGFERELLVPLWTEINDLMPLVPSPRALPFLWQWEQILPLVQRSGELIAVGRGGERRAIALANPGLGGRPFATPTLWAAVQYLQPGEVAPEHRHSHNAFRFVLEGEGVWTVVDGDPVEMRRGDLLLTPGWCWHGHQNANPQPMAWLDGLDIPLVHATDSSFFEYGPEQLTNAARPLCSRSEQLWAHAGLQPLSQVTATPSSPLRAYRWRNTDAALADQLRLEDEGQPGVLEPGHAAVRFSHPGTGGDVMPTLRAEFHRLRAGAQTARRREVGSSVWQVFEGRGTVTVAEHTWKVHRGDLFVVPSWQALRIRADISLDLFRFSDTPLFERLHQYRQLIEDEQPE